MTNKDMALPQGDRATHEPSPDGLGHSVGIPSAVHAAVVLYRKPDGTIVASLGQGLSEAIAVGVASQIAEIGWVFEGMLTNVLHIEARRAETGAGSVHESAVPQECAQGDPHAPN